MAMSLRLESGKEPNQQEKMVQLSPVTIDIPTTDFSSGPSHHNPQVQISNKVSLCLKRLPPDLKDKKASNALVKDQTNVDTSERKYSLLHQTPFETSSFHTPRDLLPEGQQTSLGVIANDDSAGLPSQQQSRPDAITHSEAQTPFLQNEFNVGSGVIMISAGGGVSVLSGFVGNETTRITHKIFFRAFTVLNYISFLLGVGILLLILLRPQILVPGLVTIIKVTMWGALASTTYSLACATCLFLSEPVGVILVLVAPLVMVCLVSIPSFCCRKKSELKAILAQ